MLRHMHIPLPHTLLSKPPSIPLFQNLVTDNEKAFHRGFLFSAARRFTAAYHAVVAAQGSEPLPEAFLEEAKSLNATMEKADVKDPSAIALDLMVELNDFCDTYDSDEKDPRIVAFAWSVRARVRLCTFHVLKAWNDYFKQRLTDEVWQEVHTLLRYLLESTDSAKFHAIVQTLYRALRDGMREDSANKAVKYLATTYMDDHLPRKWRGAQRMGHSFNYSSSSNSPPRRSLGSSVEAV